MTGPLLFKTCVLQGGRKPACCTPFNSLWFGRDLDQDRDMECADPSPRRTGELSPNIRHVKPGAAAVGLLPGPRTVIKHRLYTVFSPSCVRAPSSPLATLPDFPLTLTLKESQWVVFIYSVCVCYTIVSVWFQPLPANQRTEVWWHGRVCSPMFKTTGKKNWCVLFVCGHILFGAVLLFGQRGIWRCIDPWSMTAG